jgi:hypothetical protein
LGLGTLFFLLALGIGFVHAAITTLIPGFDTNYHIRMLVIVAFSGSILAGLGADFLIKGKISTSALSKFNKVFLIIIVVGLVGLLIGNALLHFGKEQLMAFGKHYVEKYVFGKSIHKESLEYYYDKLDNLYSRALSIYSISNPGMYLPFMLGFAWVVLIILYNRKKINLNLWKSLVIIFISLDLLHFGIK